MSVAPTGTTASANNSANANVSIKRKVSDLDIDDPENDSCRVHYHPQLSALAHHPLAPDRAPATSGTHLNPDPNHVQTQHIGQTTELEPLLLSYLPFDTCGEAALAEWRIRRHTRASTSADGTGTFVRVFDPDLEEGEHMAEDGLMSGGGGGNAADTIKALQEVEACVGVYGPELVEMFFERVHPAFPVLEEGLFRREYERIRERGQLRKNEQRVAAISGTGNSIPPVLLAAVYLLALKWIDKPSNTNPTSNASVEPQRLEKLAVRLLANALNAHTYPTIFRVSRAALQTLQAGLLISQKSPLNTPFLIAQLVALAFDLGLHADGPGISDRGLRRRLAWALYVQDKWCALIHGRPSHVDLTEWMVANLEPSDFESGYSNGYTYGRGKDGQLRCLLFMHMVSLTKILADILDTFYTLRAAGEFARAGQRRTRLILERAKPVQIRLKEWFSNLPHSLRMDSSTHETHSPDQDTDNNQKSPNFSALRSCNNGALHLAYFATEITLHRVIIRSLSPKPDPYSISPSPSAPTVDAYLAHICRAAAKTRLISAMDLVNRLRPRHLRAFWPSSARTCFALVAAFAALLRATAVNRAEAAFYESRMREYRWTLEVSSADAPFLEWAVGWLDANDGIGRWVPEKPEADNKDDGNGDSSSQGDLGVGLGLGLGSNAGGSIGGGSFAAGLLGEVTPDRLESIRIAFERELDDEIDGGGQGNGDGRTEGAREMNDSGDGAGAME